MCLNESIYADGVDGYSSSDHLKPTADLPLVYVLPLISYFVAQVGSDASDDRMILMKSEDASKFSSDASICDVNCLQ